MVHMMPTSTLDRERRWYSRADGRLVFMAAMALFFGVLIYLIDRPAGSTYFLASLSLLSNMHGPYFGALGNHIPDFVHPYAFILLTVVFAPWSRRLLAMCICWWAIDSFFEIGQHSMVSTRIAAVLPEWFQKVPVLDGTRDYFLHGTFDPLDLLAITLGCVAAYFTVRLIDRKRLGDTLGTTSCSTHI